MTTKKEGREWLALSLYGFDSHLLMCGEMNLLKKAACSFDETVVYFVESETIELIESRGDFADYDSFFFFVCSHFELLSGNFLPYFKSTNYPVSQDRNVVKPIVERSGAYIGCLDKGLRLGDRKARNSNVMNGKELVSESERLDMNYSLSGKAKSYGGGGKALPATTSLD